MRGLRRRPIGDILVSMGVISSEQLESALAEQRQSHKRLGELLVAIGIVSEEHITQARAIQMDVVYADVEQNIDPNVLYMVNESIARSYKLIPVKREGNLITLAMTNPMDVEAIDLVQFETRMRIEPALATEWKIMESINKNYGPNGAGDLEDYVEQATSNIQAISADVKDEFSEDIDKVKRESDQPPIVRMVNLILTQAIRRKASDVHIEPTRNKVNVRYRIDGELQLIRSIPRSLHAAIISRIKIMSELDISERRMPQDGRISARIDDKNIDLRVSTSPTLFGERLVLRILDRTRSLIPIESLGFSDNDIEIFKKLILQPYGIILVTGPTGSGKTTTLYAALNSLKSENINIMTVEDPVEYELEGTSQTNVNPRIGLNFAKQLRSILRQDPDIVLVGEIRDAETADVAFRAALTGHLVLSTLHCNDAPSAITRLLDMDVETFLVSSAINGVLAQRLVRLLCPDCKEPYMPNNEIKSNLGLPLDDEYTFYRPVGCSNCDGTGYRGRTAIREIMVVNEQIRRMAMAKSNTSDIRNAAITSGMKTMRDDGARKVIAGITSYEEVQRKVLIETEIDYNSE